jgi:hypothetical protein
MHESGRAQLRIRRSTSSAGRAGVQCRTDRGGDALVMRVGSRAGRHHGQKAVNHIGGTVVIDLGARLAQPADVGNPFVAKDIEPSGYDQRPGEVCAHRAAQRRCPRVQVVGLVRVFAAKPVALLVGEDARQGGLGLAGTGGTESARLGRRRRVKPPVSAGTRARPRRQ